MSVRSVEPRTGPEVESGCNPIVPAKDDAVLCWGVDCKGSFQSPFAVKKPELVHAMACRCMRLTMGWKLDG